MDSFHSGPFIDAVLMASAFKPFKQSNIQEYDLAEVTHPRAVRDTVLERIITDYTQANLEDFSLDRLSPDGSVNVTMDDILKCTREDEHARRMLSFGMFMRSYMKFGDLIVARKIPGTNIVVSSNFYDVQDVEKFVTPEIAKYFLGGIVGITIVNKRGTYKDKGGHAMMIRWCDDLNGDGHGELKICNSWGESSCMSFDERVRNETRAMVQKEYSKDDISYNIFMKKQNAFINKFSTTGYFHMRDDAPPALWDLNNMAVWLQ